jgi:hypothetical protein
MRLLLLALLILPASLRAQSAGRPSRDELDRITARGVALARYDEMAWNGTDSLLARVGTPRAGGRYLARALEGGAWEFVFGRLSADSAFRIEFRARAGRAGAPLEVLPAPSEPDTGYYARGAVALERAIAEFGRAGRPYNAAVLPDGSGGWFVYLYPAPTQQGVWPLGGDVRYQLDASGRTVMAKRQLHRAIIDQRPSPDAAAGYHTAILDDRPEDTDVLMVLRRWPRIPQYVGTEHFIYQIDPAGRISVESRRR